MFQGLDPISMDRQVDPRLLLFMEAEAWSSSLPTPRGSSLLLQQRETGHGSGESSPL